MFFNLLPERKLKNTLIGKSSRLSCKDLQVFNVYTIAKFLEINVLSQLKYKLFDTNSNAIVVSVQHSMNVKSL